MQTTAQAPVDRLRQWGVDIGFAKTLVEGQPDRFKILREGVEATACELRDAPGTPF